MSFEDKLFDNIDRSLRNEDVLSDEQKLNDLHARVEKKMRHRTPELEEFLDQPGYNNEDTEKHIQDTQRIENAFRENDELSDDPEFLEKMKNRLT